jgi:hypothetical protein
LVEIFSVAKETWRLFGGAHSYLCRLADTEHQNLSEQVKMDLQEKYQKERCVFRTVFLRSNKSMPNLRK